MKRERARRLRAAHARKRGYVIHSSEEPQPTETRPGSSGPPPGSLEQLRRLDRLRQDKRHRLAIRQRGLPDPGPLEGMCEVCGCTDEDPCIDDHGEPCGWQDATKTLCTTCKELYSK